MSEENNDLGRTSPDGLDPHPGPRPPKDIAENWLKRTRAKLAAKHLLSVAEALSVLSALAAVAVFGAQLAATGSLPSAVPIDGGACWS